MGNGERNPFIFFAGRACGWVTYSQILNVIPTFIKPPIIYRGLVIRIIDKYCPAKAGMLLYSGMVLRPIS
jgi:hypothetical protein